MGFVIIGKIVPKTMYNILNRIKNRKDLPDIIIENKDYTLLQRQAAEVIKNNNPSKKELAIIKKYIPNKR